MAKISIKSFVPSKITSAINAPIMFVIIVIAAIFVMSITFRVSDIVVNGNEHYTDAEIINAIDIEEGDNLFFFDRFAAVSRVFAKLPYVEEVTVTRNLPNKVIIEVVENKAIAYIKLGSELWTIDKNCKVLGKAAEGEEVSLVQISGLNPGTLFVNEALTTEDNNERAIEFLVSILHQIDSRDLAEQITEVDMTNVNGVIMQYSDKYTIKLGDPYNTNYKFALIVSTISKLLEGDSGTIDVTDAATVNFTPY